ncbi:MAG: hypothetical protein AAFQ80_01175 [Cyanobacteria bacterium J06621_8]
MDWSISVGLCAICLGMGWAIRGSEKVVLNGEGVVIEQAIAEQAISNQAISNQGDLELLIFLVRSQQHIISRYQKETEEFSRRYRTGEDLAEQAKFGAGFIDEQKIDELEQRVKKSQAVLDEVLPQ